MMELRPYQSEAVEAIYSHLRERDDNPCVVLPTGCHAADHPILMFDGSIKRVQDVAVGDLLMGPGSEPRRVLALCRGEDDLFRIIPHRGEPFLVNGDHMLALVCTNEGKGKFLCRKRGGEKETISLREYLTKAKWWKLLRKLYRVPVDFSTQPDLPIPPYILGLLLGDGCLTEGVVELTTADEAIADAWIDYARSVNCDVSVTASGGRCPTYRLVRCAGMYNMVTEALTALDLAGRNSATRFIPQAYLLSSRQERLALLAGLIDSDGYTNKNGCDYVTQSRELATDLTFLVRSLGFTAHVAEKYCACQTGAGGWFFRLSIWGDLSLVPCRLQRKQPRRRGQKKDVLRTGFRVGPAGRGPFFGFALDGDHLYLDGHFVVHHNSGKTPVMATVCRDAVGRWDGRVLILAHVKELLEQAREKLHQVAPETWMKTGIYSAGLKSRDIEHPIIIAGIQSVYRRACELDAFDLVIIDECFVAGTPIRTPAGDVPIEELHVGQSICTAVGVGTIEVISARKAEQLIQVETDDGTTITCTPEHPFFTEDGWIGAGSMEIGTRLFREEDLRLLWSRFRTLDQAQAGRNGGQLYAGTAVGKAEVLLEVLLKEVREPHAIRDLAGQDAPVALETKASTDQAGGQRQAAANPSAGVVARPRSGMASRACGDDGSAARQRHSPALQAGPCASAGPDRPGVGRRQSSVAGDSLGRQEEDHVLGGARVVRVTALESHGSVPVFNLHVREHPSYYAGGLLVHNCHMIPPDGEGMYRTFIEDARKVNPNVRLIGLTATPFRMKSGMICGPQNVLNHVCYEVGVKELIVQGYLCPLISKGGLEPIDTSRLHVRAGEFVAGEAEDLMDTDELVESACREIVEQTRTRRSVLIFTAGVRHGEHVASVLRGMTGEQVATVFGETADADRDRVLTEFKAGAIKYLVNVNVLTMGFDAPNIDCVAMVRPTLSPGLYYQMVGRGFRLCDGKENCLVLDFGGNVVRHGPVDAIRVSTANGRGNGDAPAKQCPECRSLIAAGYMVCPDCGYEFPPPERRSHDSRASTAGILSGQVTTTEYEVQEVRYRVHRKLGAPDDAARTLRVEYRLGFKQYQSEWICLEHSGWARHKAASWWRKRSNALAPDSAAEAVELAQAGALCETQSITVRSTVGEKYDRIVGYVLGPKPAWREPGMDEGCEPGEEECAFAEGGVTPF